MNETYFAILKIRGPVCHGDRQGFSTVILHHEDQKELDEKINSYEGVMSVQKFTAVQESLVINEENCGDR
jgi:hypothetical protein